MSEMGSFAAYLRQNHLNALAEENQRALRALDPPMLKQYEGVPVASVTQQMRGELEALLLAWEQGRGTEHALDGIRIWEGGGVTTATPDSIEVTDMVLAAMAQKQALLSFLEGYTHETNVGKTIRDEVNKHFTTVRAEATEAVIRIRVARQHGASPQPRSK